MKLNLLVIKRFILTGTMILMLYSIVIQDAIGQTPPPPPPPQSGTNNGHGLGGNQGVPGAPVGSGLEVLLLLGAAYAAKRYFSGKKKR